ncbi:MAG: TatD family hydrolase [Candidatus Thorarchaeota archaeon]
MGGIEYVDTHCHLEESAFDLDREEVIKKALEKNIIIISSAIEPHSWEQGFLLHKNWDSVHMAVGCNPVKFSNAPFTIERIEKCKDQIVAIGEVGLDHFYERNHSNREKQEIAFRNFISISKERDLPLQVHSRSAGKAALEILTSTDIEHVQMHAFDGKSSYARTASHEYGYYFSIPTSVVRSPQKKKLVLGPIKGVRNEPSNILIAVKEIAKILAMEEEEIRNILLENTLRLYPNLTSNKLPRNQHK